jgi:1,2-diacylglycerol 3-alpha-glucosyltransferase
VAPPLRVVILSPGLGIAARGFERAARENFEALRHEPGLDVHLVKGRGRRAERERVAATVSREGRLARWVAGRRDRPDFWLEQLVFSVTVQPQLLRLRPDVVMLGEWTLTRALGHWRKVARHRFRILLYNGAAAEPPYPDAADHVQQLTPDVFDAALAAGVPADFQTVLPHGLAIPAHFERPQEEERAATRRRLGLPAGPLLISVGALNRWHKRMDYLVEEVASLSSPPHLLMLGSSEEETRGVLGLARRLLGPEGFTARTVAQPEVPAYYLAADAFVLASGYEPFGLAMVEALSHGLPVIAQDTPRSRWILGDEGVFGDFIRPGALAELIPAVMAGNSATGAEARHGRAYQMFSWDRLRPRYVEMLHRAAGVR